MASKARPKARKGGTTRSADRRASATRGGGKAPKARSTPKKADKGKKGSTMKAKAVRSGTAGKVKSSSSSAKTKRPGTRGSAGKGRPAQDRSPRTTNARKKTASRPTNRKKATAKKTSANKSVAKNTTPKKSTPKKALVKAPTKGRTTPPSSSDRSKERPKQPSAAARQRSGKGAKGKDARTGRESVEKRPAPATEEHTSAVKATITGLQPLNAPPRNLKRALKERYQIEFQVRSTPHVLFDLISTPSGFSEWFCDDVNVRGDEFAFIWNGEEEKANCIGRKHQELIRFQWEDDEDPGAYFELRIRVDPMTNDVALVVTDHAWPKDLESARMLWESQVATLLRVIGS